ncbi:hypothetical protein CR105_09660 [Massilia eurypsychrophila]|jgi:hypothetical protein|uniref:Uncharacterized protein n=1 Tax=Massilia eurypsychrophila TaxID=1485217 RepID=A0A2G8TH89_9BURK|nr:hypothetical protein [Massilia eurypsychrophila]PIL45420.1 hypothetical protein CR105_09660 [Massilia eurypsychrophila]
MTMLLSQPGAARRSACRVLVAAAVAAGGFIALPVQAQSVPETYDIAMTFTTPTSKAAPTVRARAGEPFKVMLDDKGAKMMASFVLTPAGKQTVRLEGTVECGRTKPAHPVMVAHLGSTATVKVEETGTPGCELAMVVTKTAIGPSVN